MFPLSYHSNQIKKYYHLSNDQPVWHSWTKQTIQSKRRFKTAERLLDVIVTAWAYLGKMGMYRDI